MPPKKHRFERLETTWIDGPDEKQLLSELTIGETLAFPCGDSNIGDCNVDRDPARWPDAVADLTAPPFPPRSFDTVYCDPPYSMVGRTASREWLKDVYELADQRLIVQAPGRALRVGAPAERDLYVMKPVPGNPRRDLRLFHVFDRPEGRLTDY